MFVWLKGVALGQLVYPDPILRPMQDLDIWVEAEDVAVAEREITDLGLIPVDRLELGGAGELADRMFVTTGPGRVVVELHPLPLSLSDLPVAVRTAMFERRVEIPSVAGGYALAPGDMILHTCLHVARHHRFALGFLPLLDLALCMEAWSRSIRWEEWIPMVQRIGATSVWLPLELSRRMLGAAVPDPVLEALSPGEHASDLIQLAEQQLVSTQEFPAGLGVDVWRLVRLQGMVITRRANDASTRECPGDHPLT